MLQSNELKKKTIYIYMNGWEWQRFKISEYRRKEYERNEFTRMIVDQKVFKIIILFIFLNFNLQSSAIPFL